MAGLDNVYSFGKNVTEHYLVARREGVSGEQLRYVHFVVVDFLQFPCCIVDLWIQVRADVCGPGGLVRSLTNVLDKIVEQNHSVFTSTLETRRKGGVLLAFRL